MSYIPFLKKIREKIGKEEFEWYESGLAPHILKKLVELGYLIVTHKSRAHTFYKIAEDMEEVEETKSEIDISQLDFSSIVAYDEIKEYIEVALSSNTNQHILLCGPPATAKTLFLMCLEKIGGRFITAGTSTRAGINEVLYEDCPRLLLIDELDKINSTKDISALLTWMESARVIITKHNQRFERKRDCCSVVAAANTIYGLPRELLDRFQIFYLQEYRDDEMRTVLSKILEAYALSTGLKNKIIEISVRKRAVRLAIRLADMLEDNEGAFDAVIKAISKYS